MRAVILSEIDGKLKKIVWVKESEGGVYMFFSGILGKNHRSYHKDGTVHTKIGSNYFPLDKGTPIQDIAGFVNLHNYVIPLEKVNEFIANDYKSIKDVDTIVYVNPEIIKLKRILSIILYIVKKGAEKECLSHLQKSYKESYKEPKNLLRFEVLSANFFKLEKFPGYLLGIILCGGK
jgi:hypothetical protein